MIPFALALLALAGSSMGAVPTYSTFELQARSNIVDGYNLPANSSFNSKTPALNDDGTIAFTLIYVAAGNAGLFVGSQGSGSVVYSAPAERLLSDPSINADGSVAFDQSDLLSDGIFMYDAGSRQTTQAVPPVTFNTATGIFLADDGAIGFRGSVLAGGQAWRLFDGGAPAAYVQDGSGGIAFIFSAATNDQHQIAGKVRLGSTSNDSPDQIRRYSAPGVFSLMAEDDDSNPASPYTGFDNSVSLTNDGRVAFVATTTSGDRGVFLTDGASTTTIAMEGDPDVSEVSFFAPAANDNGLVAFRGRDGAGLYAVFVGDGTTLRRVIGEHDLVPTDLGTGRIDQHDGSVTFGGGLAINSQGDVAFHATLTPENNNQIEWGSGMFIAYAEPAGPVPTVSQWGLLALAVLLVAAAGGVVVRRRGAALR